MESSDVDLDEICSICRQKWNANGSHMGTPLMCGHIFGYRCIKRWVKFALNCPICKCSYRKRDFKEWFERNVPSAEERRAADLEARNARRRAARARRRAARRRRWRQALEAYYENADTEIENDVYENAENNVFNLTEVQPSMSGS